MKLWKYLHKTTKYSKININGYIYIYFVFLSLNMTIRMGIPLKIEIKSIFSMKLNFLEKTYVNTGLFFVKE